MHSISLTLHKSISNRKHSGGISCYLALQRVTCWNVQPCAGVGGRRGGGMERGVQNRVVTEVGKKVNWHRERGEFGSSGVRQT